MEPVEIKLPIEAAIVKPDIESRIKEGKPVIITIPVDDECKSPDVYVISDSASTIKEETEPEMIPLPQEKSLSEDVYVISDDTSTVKQETDSEMIPQRKAFSEGSVSSKPTIIVNIDDDDDEDDDEDEDDDDEEEDCYENKQLTHKGDENNADWFIQDVITPVETKSAQNQNGPVNVWYVKSVKVSNQNQPKGENLNKSSYVHKINERKSGVNVLVNSSVPQQTSQNASGFPENQVLHNRQSSMGSKFAAHLPDAITIEDDLIDEMEEKIQVCPECSQCFTSLSDLEMHMKSHSEGSSWICADCGKSFYTKSSLDRHHLTHIREKPLKCPECGKGFSKQINFEMHLRLHAGEVLFPCTECEKLFSSKASCDRHIRAHKMERPHVCPQCGKGFLYNGCLIRHIRVHTGERPFPCPECGRCFRQTSALNRHIKTHTGEKPFDCSECGKCFTHQSDLNRHKETHRKDQHFVQSTPSNETALPTYIIL